MDNIFNKKNLINIVKGSAISLVISCIFLIVFASILAYTNVSENTIKPVLFIILGMSVIVGSIISTKYIRKNGFLNGALVGCMYIIILYVISSIYTSNISVSSNLIIVILLGCITGMIGGIIGVNINKK